MNPSSRNRSFIAKIRFGEKYVSACQLGRFTLHENATHQFDTREDQLSIHDPEELSLSYYFRHTPKGYLIYVRNDGEKNMLETAFDGHGIFINDNIACVHYIRSTDPALFKIDLPEPVKEGQEYNTKLLSVAHNHALGLELFKFHFGHEITIQKKSKEQLDIHLLCLARKPATLTLKVLHTNVPWRSEPNEI